MVTVFVIVGLVFAMVIPALAIYRAKEEVAVEVGSYSHTLIIKVEHPGNSDYVQIHLNCVVYNEKEYLTGTGFPDERYPAICHELIKIAGVVEVNPNKYYISLEKGEVFTFEDDILGPALKIIEKTYGKGKKIEYAPTYDNRARASMMDEAYDESWDD